MITKRDILNSKYQMTSVWFSLDEVKQIFNRFDFTIGYKSLKDREWSLNQLRRVYGVKNPSKPDKVK